MINITLSSLRNNEEFFNESSHPTPLSKPHWWGLKTNLPKLKIA